MKRRESLLIEGGAAPPLCPNGRARVVGEREIGGVDGAITRRGWEEGSSLQARWLAGEGAGGLIHVPYAHRPRAQDRVFALASTSGRKSQSTCS
jgi:hypothetical protein